MQVKYMWPLLFSFFAQAMHFDTDKNEQDIPIQPPCAKDLPAHLYKGSSAIGYTPLILYRECKEKFKLVRESCKLYKGNESTDWACQYLGIWQEENRCKNLLAKALKIVKTCNPSPEQQQIDYEKKLKEIKAARNSCKQTCIKVQKLCYLSNEYVLSKEYVCGPENRRLLCGLLNFFQCTNACDQTYQEKKRETVVDYKFGMGQMKYRATRNLIETQEYKQKNKE